MSQRRALPWIGVPLGLTAILLCARLAAVPPLTDPVGGMAPPSLHLVTPWLYLALAPAFTLWDGLSMLSMSRLQGFLTGLALLYLVWRAVRIAQRQGRPVRTPLGSILLELRTLGISIALLLAFLVTGALWHRPMLSLSGTDPKDVVVDFHSHTNLSHDVQNTWMRGFDAEANRRWHARAGFNVVFITDHNTVGGVRARGNPVLCPGIEVSAWQAHIVLLGGAMAVDRSRYNSSLDALLALLRTSESAYGSLSVASLPEYRRNHWGRLDSLVASGLDGFEIVNAAPKANELRQAERDTVIALARSRNRFVVGVSDSHGWGSTSMVWNLVRPPEPAGQSDLCAAVIGRLRSGFQAVRIVERHRLRPDSWWPGWLTPLGVVWETWRSMGWWLTVAWLTWIWGLCLAIRFWGDQDRP